MNHQAAFTQFFFDLEDPRQATKIAYPFFDVVFLTVCAAIGGAHGWEDIELFGGDMVISGVWRDRGGGVSC